MRTPAKLRLASRGTGYQGEGRLLDASKVARTLESTPQTTTIHLNVKGGTRRLKNLKLRRLYQNHLRKGTFYMFKVRKSQEFTLDIWITSSLVRSYWLDRELVLLQWIEVHSYPKITLSDKDFTLEMLGMKIQLDQWQERKSLENENQELRIALFCLTHLPNSVLTLKVK